MTETPQTSYEAALEAVPRPTGQTGTPAAGLEETPRRKTLRKSAKLRHRSLVEGLFANGRGCFDYPLRVVWRPLSAEELSSTFRDHQPDLIGPLQMMVTVPKKKRRHAVDRVLVRRRIREAFRLNCASLRRAAEDGEGVRTLSMAIIYQATENLPYARIEKAMLKLLAKIERQLRQTT